MRLSRPASKPPGWPSTRIEHVLLCMKRLHRGLRILLFHSHNMPLLLYGSEWWAPLQQDKQDLEGFLGQALLKMEGISMREHVPYSELLRERFKILPMAYYLLRVQRLRWLGHLLRIHG